MERVRNGEIVRVKRLSSLQYPAAILSLDAEKVARARFVYMLADPRRIDVARYVGCSVNVRERYRQHILEARHARGFDIPRKLWFIQRLLLLGVFPECRLIEEVPDDVDWLQREKYWIEKLRSPALTNFERTVVPGEPKELRPPAGRWW